MGEVIHMALSAKKYREHLYEYKAHPSDHSWTHDEIESDKDTRSIWVTLGSLFCFLCGEYLLQLAFKHYSSGLLFPMGFFLFWAFYYSYVRPIQAGTSEREPLRSSVFDEMLNPITMLLKQIFRLFGRGATQKKSGQRRTAYVHQETTRPQQIFSSTNHPALPKDILHALQILGLNEQCREWDLIHHRYRELAKKYHPDLNPLEVSTGKKFILFDEAYRKLASVKTRFFVPKSKNSGFME